MTGRAAFSLAGKTALVTGGRRGIGAAIVTRFADAGARVVAANRTIEPAQTAAADLRKRGLAVEAAGLPDLSRAGLSRLVSEAAAYDGLDIVVHNAGAIPGPLSKR